MAILMSLKGVIYGVYDVLSMMGFFRFLGLAMFSAILLAQTSGVVEAIQVEQGERIARLEDWQRTLELVRNFEYGALVVMGSLVTWFLKETAKNTNTIAVLGAQHGYLGDAVSRIENKLDALVVSGQGHG